MCPTRSSGSSDRMSAFTYGLAIAAGLLAIVSAVLFFTGSTRPPGDDTLMKALGVLVALRAMIGVGVMASGGDESHSVTHIAYLGVSAVMLPLVFGTVESDRSPWSSAVFGAGLLVIAVLMLRVEATG